MCGELIIDDRIMELATMLLIPPHLALACLTLQRDVYKATGHLVALNDELVWRKLKKAAPTRRYPHVYIRCIRCSVRATIHDWSGLANMDQLVRMATFDQLAGGPYAHLRQYLCDCDGATRAVENAVYLQGLVDDYNAHVFELSLGGKRG